MTKSQGIYDMHGGKHTPAYGVWCSMRSRCNNPNTKAYADYGARGITVEARWSRFSNFITDMGHPAPGMTLERKDNDKGYSKSNCIWANRTVQGRNRRNNVMITIGDETLPLSAWAERSGISYATIHQRLRIGWPADRAVTEPLITNRKGIPRGSRLFGAERGVPFRELEVV